MHGLPRDRSVDAATLATERYASLNWCGACHARIRFGTGRNSNLDTSSRVLQHYTRNLNAKCEVYAVLQDNWLLGFGTICKKRKESLETIT
jgi:hypothetical protein